MKVPIRIELLQQLELYLQKKPYGEVNGLFSELKKDLNSYSASLNKESNTPTQNDKQEELPLDVTD